MLTSSRDIKKKLEREGWVLVRVRGSHHVFRSSAKGATIVLPQPKKDWELARRVPSIGRRAGAWTRHAMSQYVAIIEDVGPDKAIGVWFPDLPGCFSAGDTLEQALGNAPQAIALYAESLEQEGKPLPRPRRLSVLKSDPTFLSDLKGNMVALISVSEPMPTAAE